MMKVKKTDIAVVGCGALGAGIAYNIAKLGRKPLVFEAKYFGYGSTGRDIGVVRGRHRDPDVARLASEGLKLHEKLPDELGSNTLFRQDGVLTVALTSEEAEALEKEFKSYASGSFIELSRDEVRSRYPYLRVDDVKLCYLSSREGLVHPLAVLWGYLDAVRRLGGEVVKPAEVISIEPKGDKLNIKTALGEYEASKVVVAAGFRSRELLSKLGIDIPLEPLAKEALVTEPMKPFLDPVIERPGTGLVVAQTMRGEVIGTVGSLGKTSDLTLSSYRFLRDFARQATQLIPAVRSLKVLRQWTWVVDTTPDGKPVIGETSVNRVYVACGMHDYGLSLVPVVSKLIGRLVVEGVEDPMLKPFSPSRFG